MRETSPATATTAAQPTDDDRDIAAEIALRLAVPSAPKPTLERLAQLLAEVRAAAYVAGVQSCEGAADDAHASGHLEALNVLRAELVAGQETHDCPACNPNPRQRGAVGVLVDGRSCPLCDGFGTL